MTAELFNTDPSKNDKPPPNGAPQGALPLKRVSATLRVVMAGVADCWAKLGNLAGMAYQAPDAVAIKGGTLSHTVIDSTCTVNAVAGGADKVFGMTAQQFYDATYPVGEARLFFIAAQPSVWPGVKATWTLIAAGNYLRTSDPIGAGTTGGNTSVNTSSSGAVAAATTGGHVLTMPELPAELLIDAFGVTDQGGVFQKGNNAKIAQDTNTGGGQAHTHTIPGIVAHAHTVGLTPLFLDVAMYRRTA